MKVANASSWEVLPPDLFGLLLRRLPSLADRVRLRAVCRPWRAGAQPHRQSLPPPLPWLALRDGCLVDLDGASVRCASIIQDGVFSYRTVDNLALLVHDDSACSLMNPLSGLTLPLPKLLPAARRAMDESRAYKHSSILKAHVKVILSSQLDSTPDPFVAVLILEGYSVAISGYKQQGAINIAICPEETNRPTKIFDLASLHGKLYALTRHEGLHVYELGAGHLRKESSSSGFHQCIADDLKQQEIYNPEKHRIYYNGTGTDAEYLVLRYLAESNGVNPYLPCRS